MQETGSGDQQITPQTRELNCVLSRTAYRRISKVVPLISFSKVLTSLVLSQTLT